MGDERGFFGRLFGRRRSEQRPEDSRAPSPAIVDLAPADAQRMIAAGGALQILDVRFPNEQGPDRKHRIDGAVLIPLPELALRVTELDPARPTLVYCEHGMRSQNACAMLGTLGFATLYNLAGGMSDYASWLAAPKS